MLETTSGQRFISGVIEGFYGRPWRADERATLFKWMAAWQLNTYMYAPKDDVKLRAAWRVLYDDNELQDLKTLIALCAQHDIAFVYTIAPGLDMRYADPADLRALKNKVAQLLSLGVTHVCILFDDIPHALNRDDKTVFGSFAAAQAHVTNELFAFVQAKTSNSRNMFFFCPTEYCARMATPSVSASPYLQELGETLHPAIDIFWTGPEIVSQTITGASITTVQQVLKRKPLIWDNLHANDYDIRRVYLGPYAGRDNTLKTQTRGILSNPNNEFEANYLPLQSLAHYIQSDSYNPAQATTRIIKNWLPRFKTYGQHPITPEELELLVAVLYLPFSVGEPAQVLLDTVRTLLNQDPETWDDAAFMHVRHSSEVLVGLFEKLTELENRDLLYALYGYVWEARHELMYVSQYLTWLKAGRPGGVFAKPDALPNTYREGFVAALEQLLPLDSGRMQHE